MMETLELRNILLLALCWAWAFSTATLLTFVGPKASETISDSTFDATMTLALIIIGTAFCNIPSPYIFDTFGRKVGFLLGGVSTITGSLISISGLHVREVPLLYLGSLLVGIGVGFGQFYRFAAMEVASEANKGWAVTSSLTGGCFAAFLGPTLGLYSKDMTGTEFEGSYVSLCLLGTATIVTVLLVDFEAKDRSQDSDHIVNQQDAVTAVATATNKITALENESATVNGSGYARSQSTRGNWRKRFTTVAAAVRSRIFIQATLISMLSQIYMIIIMINSVVELQLLDYNILIQSLVLDLHFLAMFATGPFTGYLLNRFGVNRVALLGWGTMLLSLIVFLSQVALWSFFIGVVLMGASWNLLFSTGTVMLTKVYSSTSEDNSIQGVFEFIVNAVSGLTAALAGFVLAQFGWFWLICILSIGFALVTLLLPCYYLAFYHDQRTAEVLVAHGGEQLTSNSPDSSSSSSKSSDESALISTDFEMGTRNPLSHHSNDNIPSR